MRLHTSRKSLQSPRKPPSLNLGRRIDKALATHGRIAVEVTSPIADRVAKNFGGAFAWPDDDRVFLQRGLPTDERRRVVRLLLKVLDARAAQAVA